MLLNVTVSYKQGATTSFNVREMFEERHRLEATLEKAVRERLGGTCCAKDCSSFDKGNYMYSWLQGVILWHDRKGTLQLKSQGRGTIKVDVPVLKQRKNGRSSCSLSGL